MPKRIAPSHGSAYTASAMTRRLKDHERKRPYAARGSRDTRPSVTVRVERSTLEAVDAARDGMTRSAVVDAALLMWLGSVRRVRPASTR